MFFFFQNDKISILGNENSIYIYIKRDFILKLYYQYQLTNQQLINNLTPIIKNKKCVFLKHRYQ